MSNKCSIYVDKRTGVLYNSIKRTYVLRGDNMSRRYKLTNRKRFFMFLASMFMIMYFAGMIVNAGAVSQDHSVYDTVMVRAGDTLWEIARNNCAGDVRPYIYEIKKINNLESDVIYEGQLLMLPSTNPS